MNQHNPKEVPMGQVTRPEALITSPSANTWCVDCDVQGVRYSIATKVDLSQPGTIVPPPREFAHCPECGTTDLLDDRSPFEVLDEAIHNAEDGTIDAGVRIERRHVAGRVAAVASGVSAEHLATCSDCARWARIVGVR